MTDPLTPVLIDSPGGSKRVLLDHLKAQLPLTELLRHCGLPLNTRCGQRGKCDGCLVELIRGHLTHQADHHQISADGQPVSVRGCEYCLSAGKSPGQETHLCVPARSLLAYQPQVLKDYRINVPFALQPLWQALPIDSPMADLTQLLEHLRGKLGHQTPLTVHETLTLPPPSPATTFYAVVQYRPSGWQLTALTTTPPPVPLGLAIDIGTTTVVLLLVNLQTGKVLAQSADFNQQIHLGDDVVTRITLCAQDPAMVGRLHEALCENTLLPLLQRTLESAGLPPQTSVQCLAVAGNTTMQHLLVGADPSGLGTVPFRPEFLHYRCLPGDKIFSDPKVPTAAVHVLPSAAAYIGADLTAGILASGLLYDDGPSLLIDIGTNGEIILKHGDTFLGCATAAGPAFEGAGLACGMRAGDGAISFIHMQADPLEIEVRRIGNHGYAAGLCGSAYVDFLAEARRVGLIDPMGRFDLTRVPEARQHIMPWYSRRDHRPDQALRLAYGQAKRPIVVAEADIASLLASKAAIAAGIIILLRHVNITPAEIKRVYLAGGFGTYMIAANAVACGLLPGFSPGQIVPVGNTALAGAYLTLVDASALDEIRRIAERIRTIELNLAPEFEATYIDQLMLPEPPVPTDLSR